MVRVVLLLLSVGLTIYALVDCWRSTDAEVRTLPRPLWFLVALIPLAGGVLWLLYGRPTDASVAGAQDRRRGPAPTTGPTRRSLAPDDDPDFLAALEQRARQARREAAREQRRREKEAERLAKEQAKEQAREAERRARDGAETTGEDDDHR